MHVLRVCNLVVHTRALPASLMKLVLQLGSAVARPLPQWLSTTSTPRRPPWFRQCPRSQRQHVPGRHRSLSRSYGQHEQHRKVQSISTNASSKLTPDHAPPPMRMASSMTLPTLTRITVANDDNQDGIAYIRRSYPNAKSEKLVAGLEQLLGLASSSLSPLPYNTDNMITTTSEDSSSSIGSNSNNSSPARTRQQKRQRLQPYDRWTLSKAGDAIHRAYVLYNGDESSSTSLNELMAAIDRVSNELNHHAHVSYSSCFSSDSGEEKRTEKQRHRLQTMACVITCTTHVPHGLSLKDVKLATQVDDILLDYHYRQRSFPSDDHLVVVDGARSRGNSTAAELSDMDETEVKVEAVEKVIAQLIRDNEAAAERARTDPASACRVGGSSSSSSSSEKVDQKDLMAVGADGR